VDGLFRFVTWPRGGCGWEDSAIGRMSRRLGRGAHRVLGRAGCRSCGKCCELFGANLTATPGDVARWTREGRFELLARVSSMGHLWIDPATGTRLSRCPYLVRIAPGRARCRIHATKPQMCRDYPTLAHGKRCVANRLFPLNH